MRLAFGPPRITAIGTVANTALPFFARHQLQSSTVASMWRSCLRRESLAYLGRDGLRFATRDQPEADGFAAVAEDVLVRLCVVVTASADAARLRVPPIVAVRRAARAVQMHPDVARGEDEHRR